MNTETLAHLDMRAIEAMALPQAERILYVLAGSWMPLEHSMRAIKQMERLLAYPRVTRPPDILIVGASNSGKSTILERFKSLHLPDLRESSNVATSPVISIESPPGPDISDFYSRILDELFAVYKPTAPAHAKYSQIKRLFRELGVQMLIIDEIQNLIVGSTGKQRQFRQAIKGLGNETKVRIVAAGIEDAYNAITVDSQMASRFETFVMPSWSDATDVAVILSTLELRTPLKYASHLKDEAILLEVMGRAEGVLGDICHLIRTAAVDAIETGAEKITLSGLRGLKWVPPSKRRQFALPTP